MDAGRHSGLWQARITCLSVFGPYVTGSARTEQIVVFGLFAWVIVTSWPRMMTARFGPAPFLAAWCGLYAVILIASAFRPFDPRFLGSQPPSHLLAAFMLPVALMTLTWYWTLRAQPLSLIRAVAPLIVTAMCANAVLAIAQATAGNAAVVSWLPRFWDAFAGATGFAAPGGMGNGRYTGIFSQPAEAGIAYGVALLCLIWLARRRAWRPLPVTIAAALLAAGGTFTISKVFLLGALPVAAVTVMRGPARFRIIAVSAAVAAAFWLAASTQLLPRWNSGPGFLTALAHPHGSIVTQYTAGRYGAGSTLGTVAADVLHVSPVAGFGADGLAVPYDSLWLEVLVAAGVMGVILAVAVFGMLGWRLARLRGVLGRADWYLAAGTAFLVAGASFGIPSLTANRAATLLWLVLGILVTARCPSGEGARRSARTHTPRSRLRLRCTSLPD